MEVQTLHLSTTAQLIKDVNAFSNFSSNWTSAGSNLFDLVKDSSGSGSYYVSVLELTASRGVHGPQKLSAPSCQAGPERN